MNKRICLLNLEQLAIIVPERTGSIYFNYTGLKGDHYQQCQGILVPVSDDRPVFDSYSRNLREEMDLLFSDGQSVRAQLPKINSMLQALSCSDTIGVAPEKLAHSERGWIYVSISPKGEFSQFEGFEPFIGILTWRQLDTNRW